MSSKIGSYDAKTKLPEILRQVAAGESFTVTNRGKAVADITPTYASETRKTQTAIANLMAMATASISDQHLAELKTQGRK